METIRRKAKEKLIAHGIRYLTKDDGSTVKLEHIRTSELVRAAAALEGDENE